jgi:hypothetical protein
LQIEESQGAEMNRKDYLDGKVDHHTYYSALADVIGRASLEKIVLQIASLEKLQRAYAVEKNLNTITLARWDGMHHWVRKLVSANGPAVMAISWNGTLPAHSISWSLSESVCVLKTVARQMLGAK